MSMPAMELGPLIAHHKMNRRKSRDKLVIGENQVYQAEEKQSQEEADDIFTFYTWSASRQPRDEIEKERRRLRDSVRDQAMVAVFENYMKAYGSS